MTDTPKLPDLGALMKMDLEFNQQIVRGGGEVMPRWVARTADGETLIIATPWGDEEEKVRAINMLRMAFLVCDVTSYTFSGEVWIAEAKTREEALNGPPPSERPNRREAISVLGVDQHGAMHVTSEIIRGEDGVTFGEIIGMGEQTTIEGRLTNMLPPPDDDTFPPPIKKALRASLMTLLEKMSP